MPQSVMLPCLQVMMVSTLCVDLAGSVQTPVVSSQKPLWLSLTFPSKKMTAGRGYGALQSPLSCRPQRGWVTCPRSHSWWRITPYNSCSCKAISCLLPLSVSEMMPLHCLSFGGSNLEGRMGGVAFFTKAFTGHRQDFACELKVRIYEVWFRHCSLPPPQPKYIRIFSPTPKIIQQGGKEESVLFSHSWWDISPKRQINLRTIRKRAVPSLMAA